MTVGAKRAENKNWQQCEVLSVWSVISSTYCINVYSRLVTGAMRSIYDYLLDNK